MLTLEKISEMIQTLQAYASSEDMDFDVLRQKNKDLFFSLLQEDSFYFVAANPDCEEAQLHRKSFLPYIAPATQQSKLPYLRIFSDKDTAEAFASSVGLPKKNCVPLLAVESVQLAKYWMLRGVYGYMLNDGSVWVSISFQDYLCMIFHELLGRPEMYNEDFAHAVDLLILVDCGESLSKSIDGSSLSLSQSDESTTTISLQELLEDCLNTEEIHVSMPLLSFSVPSSIVLQAAKEFHFNIRKQV